MQKWCMECGEENKPIPATTEVDGDPLCYFHAMQRDSSREVQAVKPSVDEPVAVKENKTVETFCLCGCGRTPSPGRAYVWGHKSKAGKVKSGGGAPKRAPKASVPAPEAPAADGNFIDLVWAALPVELKKAALRSLL